MKVRGKVMLELGVIAVCTAAFLILFPRRNTATDVGLAVLALLGIAASAGYTRRVVWAALPPLVTENRFRRCALVTFWVTVPAVLLILLIGSIAAYRSNQWPAFVDRMFHWRVLAAFGCYLPWAFMQQTLLQFYLLGRLLVLFPEGGRWVPMMITGVCFGLVHLPELAIASVTVLSGTLWSYLYYRYRVLLPLAFSHATLGLVFHYGILGHDLANEWRALFR